METEAHDNLCLDREQLFARFVKSTMQVCDRVFNAEEASGKYLDLNKHFRAFKNLQEVQTLLQQKQESEGDKFGPAAKAGASFKAPVDYLSWLKCFHRLAEHLPLSIKQSQPYLAYVFDLSRYLTQYLRKSRPLDSLTNRVNHHLHFSSNNDKLRAVTDSTLELENEFEETFEQEWAAGSLYAWEDTLRDLRAEDSLYCKACEKSFATEGVYKSHLSGKRHKKAAQKMQEAADNQEVRQSKLKTVAFLESWILHLATKENCLAKHLIATQN